MSFATDSDAPPDEAVREISLSTARASFVSFLSSRRRRVSGSSQEAGEAGAVASVEKVQFDALGRMCVFAVSQEVEEKTSCL